MAYDRYERLSPNGITAHRKDGTARFIEPDDPEWAEVEAAAGPFVEVVPVPTEYDVRQECARRLASIVRPYTQQERDTWIDQVAQSEAILAKPSAPAPLVRALASVDGVKPKTMAQKIIAKRDANAVAYAEVLAGQRRLLALDEIPLDYKDSTHWSEK